jgi:DNA-directed RNA polymerase subunit RPC12/RpoP
MNNYYCPKCLHKAHVTDFAGDELKNGKILICPKCHQRFVIFY